MDEVRAKPRRWELDRAAFQALLSAMHKDPAHAGDEYESLRRRAIQFFLFHGVISSEELADETLNRLARKLQQGEVIENVFQYAAGIARMLLLEEQHRVKKEARMMAEVARLTAVPPEENPTLPALEACLELLPAAGQRLIVRYYLCSQRARIVERQKMAEEMGISLNSLRNRALRLREKLELCVRMRLSNPPERDIHRFGLSKGEELG